MDFIGELAVSLGLGGIPILNEENKRLHEALKNSQIESEKVRLRSKQEDESIKRIYGHVVNIKEAYNATKHLVTATREQQDTEIDMKIIAENSASRNKKEVHRCQKDIDRYMGRNEDLEEEVNARDTINHLLDDEHETDITKLMKWTSDVDQYEEDIFTLLRFKHQDEIRIKEHHLKLERARSKVGQSKKALDAASTDSRMAQLALDKTAEGFRQLHAERSTAMTKWQEALALISVRENELQVAFEKVSAIKSNVLDLDIELKEQTSFLDNEKGNIKELEAHISSEEAKIQRLNAHLEKLEAEVREFESEITLEKRQMWKVGAEIESKKIRMRDTKNELAKKKKQVEKLRNEANELKDKKISCNNRALTSEERASQMQRLLDQEQLQYDLTRAELHKSKERMLMKQKELKDLTDEEEINAIRVQGLTLERGNLDKQTITKKLELIKREDVAVSNDQRLVSIEREIARIRGTMALSNRAELKSTLENLKIELEGRQLEKRNLDHLVHKMMSEVKKVTKDIENLEKTQDNYTTKLEEVQLVNESCEREHKQLYARVEALLLEEKMLKLTERKVKADLENLHIELKELRKEDLEINEQLREQRADLESKRELYTAQSRCLKDEISTIRHEIRERKDRIDKLKIKYDHTVKALGPVEKPKEASMPSHAQHMVRVAQEKAELAEQSELLAKKIETEEEELASLEKAMKLMKSSNDAYRVTNCRQPQDVYNDQTIELEASIKNKTGNMKRLKVRLDEIVTDIDQLEYLLKKCSMEVGKMESFVEGKSAEIGMLEKELKEQDKKFYRAKNVADKLSSELKELVPNPEAYEHDIDLREEKERQRTALIHMREISLADPNFGQRVSDDLSKMSLCIPPVSRLEARATSSSRSGVNTASTRIYTTTSNASSSGNYYRGGGGHVSDSVIVMELGRGQGSGGRSKTAMTVH